MEKVIEEIKILIEIYKQDMDSKAQVEDYIQAHIFQIRIGELKTVLLMLKRASNKES